jgi:hypothetical protein
MGRRGFYLPSGLALSSEQQIEIADAVQRMMERVL